MFKNMFKYLKMCEQCNNINNYYYKIVSVNVTFMTGQLQF